MAERSRLSGSDSSSTGAGRSLEVLPREEYGEQHLPGAINIPLKELDADAVAGLDRDRP